MKKIIEGIKELRKKPYGNAILFFGGYLIFFLGLALFSRVALNNKPEKLEYEEGISIDKSIDLSVISSANYRFLYTIVVDNNSYIYDGVKNGNTTEFTYNNEKYTYRDNRYYKSDGSLVDEPYKFSQFLQVYNLNDLLKKSYFNSKTEYDNGRIVLNYLLSSNTIINYFEGLDSDYDEIPNTYSIDVNGEDGSIYLELGLDSYCKLKNLCTNSMKIKLQYSDFSK